MFLEVFALSQAVRHLLLAAMADGPLAPDEYAVYSVVFEEESVTPTQMGHRLGMPKTTVMERVRVMEERGHVRRVTNPRDGRSYQLVLTASGLAVHRQSHERFEDTYRAFLGEFGGSERRAAARLAQIRDAVSAASDRRRAPSSRPRRAAPHA